MKVSFALLIVVWVTLCISPGAFAQENKSAIPPQVDNSATESDEIPQLDIGIEHRTRYETLDNRFRLGETGSDQLLPQRTRLRLEIKRIIAPLGFVMEFEDARVHLDDSGSTLTNGIVNENDITQLYFRFSAKTLGSNKISSAVYAGRQSFDLGSRRFVARNLFRNTTNSFDAVRWVLGDGKVWQLTTFLSRPVVRRMHQPDAPGHAGAFWGAFLSAKFSPGFQNEFYYFGIRESTTSSKSYKRRFSTVGARILKSPKAGEVSYEFETALQFGKRRALDHLAHFEHISADYSFKAPWKPMITARYDYASGDGDPDDTRSGTFDTLFGARRFDFGPTGICGAFSRANIHSPGWGLQLNPTQKLKFSQSMRWLWLAQSKDEWVGTKLKDPSGQSGSYLGSQIELVLSYKFNKYFQAETGYNRFIKGSYPERVPQSPGAEDSNYFYVQASFAFNHLISLK